MTEQEKVFRELLELRIATSIPGACKYQSPEYNQQRRRYWEARLQAAQEKDAAKYREYGYGLVDKEGNPYEYENKPVIVKDRFAPLDPLEPYREVLLFYKDSDE